MGEEAVKAVHCTRPDDIFCVSSEGVLQALQSQPRDQTCGHPHIVVLGDVTVLSKEETIRLLKRLTGDVG